MGLCGSQPLLWPVQTHGSIAPALPHRDIGASWLEQLLTKAFCPAWRLSVPPGVLKASEVDLEPVEPVERRSQEGGTVGDV